MSDRDIEKAISVSLQKAQFVGKELNDLLVALGDGVEGCYYEFQTDAKGTPICEIVRVQMRNRDEIVVNVTMDSLSAIVRDVMQII